MLQRQVLQLELPFKSTSAAVGSEEAMSDRLIKKNASGWIEQFAVNHLKFFADPFLFSFGVVYLGDWDTCTRTNIFMFFFCRIV